MKKNEIQVGKHYTAKVSGILTTVRVDAITEQDDHKGRTTTHYAVTNLKTARRTSFRSAMKFRGEVKSRVEKPTCSDFSDSPATSADSTPTNAPATTASSPSEDEVVRTPPWCSDRHPIGEIKTEGEQSPPFAAIVTDVVPNAEASSSGNKGKQSMPTPATTSAAITAERCISAVPCRTDKDRNPAAEMTADERAEAMMPVATADRLLREERAVKSPLAGVLLREKMPTPPHLIVEARAGTGKTTTAVEGLKVVKGLPTKIIPSPQQAAVWEQMKLSVLAKTICFCAFNKSIATELQSRVPAGCEAMTLHSLGFKAVRRAFSRVKVNNFRVQDIISDLLGADIRDLRKEKPLVLRATEELVGLCKMNLTDPTTEALSKLASHYNVEMNGERDEVFALVPRVLERCKDVDRDGCIDFDDMIWLAVALNLPVFQYDLLIVDEAQDLNRCQQALAKRAGRRLILIGDPRQAIYGFAGADSESMTRMGQELRATDAGCVTLPLTVTRRCGKAIVAEAQKIVPEFEAHESNPEGKVVTYLRCESKDYDPPADKQYRNVAKDGDMVLCRVNAPLVSQCFKFLKAGRRANIQGRDIGAGLIALVKKLVKDETFPSRLLIERLSDWESKETSKENAKRNPDENRLIAITDKFDCLVCFTEGADLVRDVIRKIESVFTDDKEVKGVRLSSIHKAKGLEAPSVFFLQPPKAQCPHPMAKTDWQIEQEYNLLYVGCTRAIEVLYHVS